MDDLVSSIIYNINNYIRIITFYNIFIIVLSKQSSIVMLCINKIKINLRIGKWMLKLLEYKYEMEYHPGIKISHALS